MSQYESSQRARKDGEVPDPFFPFFCQDVYTKLARIRDEVIPTPSHVKRNGTSVGLTTQYLIHVWILVTAI